MKIVDIRKRSTSELTKESTQLQEEIVELRKRLISGELQNVRALRHKKKDLARVFTVLTEQLSKEDM